jgi:hypothetical protein
LSGTFIAPEPVEQRISHLEQPGSARPAGLEPQPHPDRRIAVAEVHPACPGRYEAPGETGRPHLLDSELLFGVLEDLDLAAHIDARHPFRERDRRLAPRRRERKDQQHGPERGLRHASS